MTEPVAGETVQLSGMRAAIARRMQQSLQTMAQLTLFTSIDARPLTAFRQELRADGRYSGVTYNDVFLLASARVLPEHPRVNATLDGASITCWKSVNLGFAVALDDGLMVPVVYDCETKSLIDIVRAVRELTERAGCGTLAMRDVLGGTFTVSNMGSSVVDHFTPIINPPQVAILGIGRLTDECRLSLSLTIDHRALDGAAGSKFLGSLCAALGKPGDLAL